MERLPRFDREKKPGLPVLTQGCNRYCCSYFINYRDEYTHADHGDELQNDVHPVFTNFKLPPGVTRSDVLPSLRLATLLLGTERASEYITTVIEGRLLDPKGDDIRRWENQSWEEAGVSLKDCKVTSAYLARNEERVIKDANEILMRMKEMVCFEAIEMSDPTAHGYTERRLAEPLTLALQGRFPGGVRSRTVLNATRMRRMTFPHHSKTASERSQLLVERFELAVTLVHELAHALNMAAFGRGDQEPLYEDYKGGREAGFTFTAHVFGGANIEYSYFENLAASVTQSPDALCDTVDLDGPPDPHMPVVLLSPWPSKREVLLYHARHQVYAPFREMSNLQWYHLYRIPSAFVESLFTTKFWQTTNECLRGESLRPPVIASFPFWFDPKEPEYARPLYYEEAEQRLGPRRAHSVLYCEECPPGEGAERCPRNPASLTEEEIVSTSHLEGTTTLSKKQLAAQRARAKAGLE